ncbi:hypothetical protein AAG906_020706 [Vitis piasezkii]
MLDMLFQLDLSLLEVLFIYTVKMSRRKLVKGNVLVSGPWSGLSKGTNKERQGHLVEWVEKASFTLLNKLFEIDTNLLALIDNPKSFIIPAFSRLAPSSLVSGPFREAREKIIGEDIEASSRCWSFILQFYCPPPTQKKKEPTTRPVRSVRTPPPTSLSSPSVSSSSSSSFSLSFSDGPETGVDRVEEDMASNLRARFHERQRKRLSESIAINTTPSKKASLKPASAPPPMPIPSTITTTVTPKPDAKPLSANDIYYHDMRRPFCSHRSSSCDQNERIRRIYSFIKEYYHRDYTPQIIILINIFIGIIFLLFC